MRDIVKDVTPTADRSLLNVQKECITHVPQKQMLPVVDRFFSLCFAFCALQKQQLKHVLKFKFTCGARVKQTYRYRLLADSY